MAKPRPEYDTIERYEDSSNPIAMLPGRIELHGTAAFADGGTLCLVSELADTTELRICLPPANCTLDPKRKPQLYLQIYYPDSRTDESHCISVRSRLETQVMSMLENSIPNYRMTRLDVRAQEFYDFPVEILSHGDRNRYNSEILRTRDQMVSFVKSQEYVTTILPADDA